MYLTDEASIFDYNCPILYVQLCNMYVPVIWGRRTTSPNISIVASNPRLSTEAAYKNVSLVDWQSHIPPNSSSFFIISSLLSYFDVELNASFSRKWETPEGYATSYRAPESMQTPKSYFLLDMTYMYKKYNMY